MNILILNHHLATWSGSETICIELVEALQSRGHHVRILCPFASPDFVHKATGDWTILLKSLSHYDAPQIDLILVFHQGLSSLSEAEFETLFAQPHRPFVAYFHLSPYEEFELPGPFVERALADVVYANSEETRQELRLHGFEGVDLFQNPAPAGFAAPVSGTGRLGTILAVSNHLPPELARAFEILTAEGIEVRRIGRPAGNRRVTPEDLRDCDMVVTIGKTVQYALRSRRPVFCYDHFQGPGWLTPWTAEDEAQNFSGRSAQTPLTAEEIADHIRNGFPEAQRWVQDNDTGGLERFHLEAFLDALLAEAINPSRDAVWPRWTTEPEWRHRFRTERSLYRLVNRNFPQARSLRAHRPQALSSGKERGETQITRHWLRDPQKGEQRVIAVFSYRYDAHLVPGLIENIGPAIHGYVAYDDRQETNILSDEALRQAALYDAAEEMGADWIFAVDPDERYEDAMADKMRTLTTRMGPVVWTMDCREMFSETQYRYDGVWSNRPRQKLFPCFPGMEPDAASLHGRWTRNAQKLPVKASGLEFYHLRMLTPERRRLRRALYAAVDPNRAAQEIGYDYLDDTRGMRLRRLHPSRRFSPAYIEDHGIWAPDDAQINQAELAPDPLPHRVRRLVRTRQMQGSEAAFHVLQDLMADCPGDLELALMAAQTALEAGRPESTIEICAPLLEQSAEPLLALRLTAQAHLARKELTLAQAVIDRIDALSRQFDASGDLKRRLSDLSAQDALGGEDALWRRWLGPARAQISPNLGVGRAEVDVAVVVLGTAADPRLQATVEALRTQSAPCEIFVINRGDGSAQSLLRDHLDVLRVIDIDERVPEGAARNIGIDASTADHVVFLEAGVIPMNDWVERLHAAHLEGYAVVPSSVRPEDGASEAALAFWLWHYDAAVPFADLSETDDRPLSYARSLFDHFGYFPPGRDGGSVRLFNARLLKKVELATDAAADLVCSFAPDPQKAEDMLREHAQKRMVWADQAAVTSSDALRFATRADRDSRLAKAKTALPDVDGDPAAIWAFCTRYAESEEAQSVETGFDILRAKALKTQAEEAFHDRPEVASALMEEALALWPASAEILLFAAKCADRAAPAECIETAVGYAQKAFAIDPEMEEALSFVLELLIKDKKFRRAHEVFQQALAVNPVSFKLFMLARMLPGAGFRAIRMMAFQRAFMLVPWAPGPNRQLVNFYKQTGDDAARAARERTFAALETAR